jgi:hypothetical protein
MPVLQNIAAFWTETALYRYATPRFYTIDEFPPGFRDLRPGALYASPWTGGWWRLADAVSYMVTASLATLDYAAKYREDLLYNRYQAGRDAIHRYRREPPYAYVVPEAQRDPMAAVELLRRLAFNGVRVARLSREVTHENMTWPRGAWVIPMDQEFAELARQLFERQEYPDLREYPNGPPEQPYDAAGWTLPLQMDVEVVALRQPLSDALRSAMAMVQGTADSTETPDAPLASHPVAGAILPPPGRITGSGPRLAVDPAENNAFRLLNRAFAAGGAVRFDSGRYTVEGIGDATVSRWVDELAVRASRGGRPAGHAVRPRVALYQPWRASMDEGWTRWLLDQYGFAYTTITNTELRAGNLGRFDVILIASDSPRGLLDGYAKGTVPPRYEGGIGSDGVRALDAFVRGGGTLVTLNQSADFAIEQLHLPVKNVVAGVDRKEFFASGSILEVTTDPSHPVMAGMPERAKIFVDGSPVFETLAGFDGAALAKYAPTGSPLLSGYLLGEKHLQGRAAALEVRHGKGRVVLIGFRPQWRGQPFGTFRVVFNAVLFGGELAARPWGRAGFWTTPADSARR